MIFFIAYRYLYAYKKKQEKTKKGNFIFTPKGLGLTISKKIVSTSLVSFLTHISTYSLTLSTAALIIILSIFNGLELFTQSFYTIYNAELKIKPLKGKFFQPNDTLLESIKNYPDIKAVTPIIEDDILLKYRDLEKVVHFKALAPNYLKQYPLDTVMISGNSNLKRDNFYFTLMGLSLQYELNLFDTLSPIQLWYPKKDINIARFNFENAFKKTHVYLGGTFAIDQNYNKENIFLPLELAQYLIDLPKHVTAIEVACHNPKRIFLVQNYLKKQFGEQFFIQTSREQQADLLRAIESERLFVFIGFTFILLVAGLNIFFTLSVIVTEKKKDIQVLTYLGMKGKIIYQIFMVLGGMIALRACLLGLLLGGVICFIQEKYGLVSMGIPNAIVDAYPVKMIVKDFLYTALMIVLIVITVAHLPAKNAQKLAKISS